MGVDGLKSCLVLENKANPKTSYKARAYAEAIKSIQLLSFDVHTAEDLAKVKGIGQGISARISDILAGREYNTLDDSPEARLRAKQITELQAIPGVGPKKATDLVDAGCTSVAEIERPEFSNLLTSSQRIQAKYYRHLSQRVHRTDAEDVATFIGENVSADFDITPVGAYRRGFETFPASTIELMLRHPLFVHVPAPNLPPPSSQSPKLSAPSTRHGRKSVAFRSTSYSSVEARSSSLLAKEVVKPLEDRGLIAATLNCSPCKWQGIVRLPTKDTTGTWIDRALRLDDIKNNQGDYRHLDLNLVPLRSHGAALLALTGDNDFKRELRAKAVKMNMVLNEFGLWKWNGIERPSGIEAHHGFWELVASETEEDIFEKLSMEWIAPADRSRLSLVY